MENNNNSTVENGRVRWAFCFGDWQPSAEEWSIALNLLAPWEPEEKERILRYFLIFHLLEIFYN